jgi:RNA processing factor Prp31
MSAVGEVQIDEKGDLFDFNPFSSDDEAIDELLKYDDTREIDLQGFKTYFGRQTEILEEAGVSVLSYDEARRRIAVKLCEKRLITSFREADSVTSAVEALEDIHKALNILVSRLAAIFTANGIRVEFEGEEVDYNRVLNAGEGVSSPLVGGLSSQIESLILYKDSLEQEIESLMRAVAPNLFGLVGPLLGAKLISLANGLERLALMPGSRIQVLGAEKAMFRHLREKGKPPKHGVIFQHPTISRSPWWQRGKISRSLGAKTAIAARLDSYSDVDLSTSLKEDFLKRVESVRKTFTVEPKKMRIIKAPKPLAIKKRKRRKRGGRG